MVQVVDVLLEVFAFEASGVTLLLKAGRAGSNNLTGTIAGRPEDGQPPGAASSSSMGARATAPSWAVQLPRMPVSLVYLHSQRKYEAAANVARALGRLARLADHAAGEDGRIAMVVQSSPAQYEVRNVSVLVV